MYRATAAELVILLVQISLMHSEAKQTKTSEFGAKKGFLQGMQGDGGSGPRKPPEFQDPASFQGQVKERSLDL